VSRRAELEARCELCQGPLELGYCEPCERLSALPSDCSPYQRLGLTPLPRLEAEAITRAERRALLRWDPLRLHKMYRPLIVRQRALIIRDAEALRSSAAQLSLYYERCVQAQLSEDPEGVAEGLSSDAQQRCERLTEGAQILSVELKALQLSLPELSDVDALQERHRVTSRASRFYEHFCAQLSTLLTELCPSSGRPDELLDELPDELQTSQDPAPLQPQPLPQLGAQLKPQIEAQLNLLTRFEELMSSFERPARSRWERL